MRKDLIFPSYGKFLVANNRGENDLPWHHYIILKNMTQLDYLDSKVATPTRASHLKRVRIGDFRLALNSFGRETAILLMTPGCRNSSRLISRLYEEAQALLNSTSNYIIDRDTSKLFAHLEMFERLIKDRDSK